MKCTARLLISSPYIGGWLPTAEEGLSSNVERVLLTRADLRDFASGSSDLDAVCRLAAAGTRVVSAHRLHAKVYVVDAHCALVTSANATFSGMWRNLECGVAFRDQESVNAAADLVLTAFGSKESPQNWTMAELTALREPVQRLRESLSASLVLPSYDERLLPDVSANNPVGQALQRHLPGWTQLALEGVQLQPGPVFSLESFVAACTPLVAARYPLNRNVRAKLRQQLQRLRDLGL